MCVRPISVKNNKLNFDPLVDRFYNCVPCGKCYECFTAIQQGYETRSIFEFYHTRKIGGVAFYVTLTYNNASVPKLPKTDIMCGSKRHLQNFFKKMRKHLPDFKYLFSLEYGSKHFRPHYHGIIFVSSYVSPNYFNELIKNLWSYGNVNFGENHGLIKDVRPFQYVAKYCVKDMYHQKFIDSLTRRYGDVIVEYMQSDSEYRNKYSLLPFHLQSNGLGSLIVNYLRDEDYIKGYFISNDIVGLNRKLAIPLYILRLRLYDKYTNDNGTISYKLNDYGKTIFVKKMRYQYKKLNQDFFDLLEYSIDNSFIYSHCPTLKKIFTLEWWNQIVREKLLDDVPALVSYKLLYHDIEEVPFSFKNFFDDLQTYIDCVMSDDWFNYKTSKKYICPFDDENKVILRILDEIKTVARWLQYSENLDRYNRSQFLKSFKTGQYKPKYKCNFDEFVDSSANIKKYKLCLITKENLCDLD